MAVLPILITTETSYTTRPDTQYCSVVTVLIRVYSWHLHFRSFHGKVWRNASAQFRKY